MCLRQICCFFIICVIPLTLFAQRTVCGRITDAVTGEPIPGASVFIANTTIGAATDHEGRYLFIIPGNGSYRLVVSHVGYQPVFRDIEAGNVSVVHDVALQFSELEEVTVTAKVRFRKNDINLFWQTLLGRAPSKNSIYAVNPEDVYYYYNPETRILKATCRVPLQIINNELGYRIQLVLDHFTHDYKTTISSWNYEYMFSELEPANDRQQTIWTKNREKAYRVSFTNFIKSLYHGDLTENGFLLTYAGEHDPFGNLHNAFDNPVLLIVDSIDGSKKLYIPPEMNNLMLICYGYPIAARDIQMFHPRTGRPYSWYSFGLFRNLIKTPSGPIRIFPDGTFSEPPMLLPHPSSKSLLGLNIKLPLDYIPETGYNAKLDMDVSDGYSAENEIIERFAHQLSVYPQEKIHLHTDRNYYVPGEKIWFKAYVADALTHMSPLYSQYTYFAGDTLAPPEPTYSRYVYVELISPVDTLVNRVMVRQENGMFYGYMPVSEIVPEGDYTLRAYTRYMENLGEGYFFVKNVRIGSLTPRPLQRRGGMESNNEAGANIVFAQTDFEVSFFSEGGNLIEGIVNKVAFKALNKDGASEYVSGGIVDENGTAVASVETLHAGMGVFFYLPVKGKKYVLKCQNRNGVEKQFELPQPKPGAFGLAVSQRNNKITVEIRKSLNTPDISHYLLAHCRGMVFHFASLDKSITFSENDLPAGVIQFVLFDKEMNPLSERLVFSKNFTNDVASIEFQTDKPSYEKREKVTVTIREEASLTSSLSDREQGVWCSVAITDDTDIAVDSTTTILSSLLLSSELKGYIENPAWYLQDDSRSAVALDYLMLTHGWRRYAVPEVAKGNLQYPEIPFQTSQSITGSVKSLVQSRPIPDSEILITADGNFGVTTTNANGIFTVQDFEFPDSTSYYIRALNARGSNRVELFLDNELFPYLAHAPQSLAVSIPKTYEDTTNISPNAFLEKAKQRSRYDEDMLSINLNEVVVSAPKFEKREESRLNFWANSGSDITVRREDFERYNPRDIRDILRRISGVIIDAEGNITIRNSGIQTQPLILIDGSALDNTDVLQGLNIFDVESIDVFKGASTAMFGTRGAGGVISITTTTYKDIVRRKQNTIEEFNYTIYTPLGYQKPVEFYSPKYETMEAKYRSIPDYRTTIFWKPDIIISDDSNEATFEFYTSDFPTTYSVVIEGLTNNGKIIRQVEKIVVE